MSDKHTDAQGELPKLPAPFGSIDIYHDNGRVTSVDGFNADQMRDFAIDYELTRRASKGQAQTSDELSPEVQKLFAQLRPEIDYWCTHRRASNLAALDAIELRFKVAQALAVRLERAAQLADSTAPGAPVEETFSCWSCKKPYTLIQRSYADGRCPHCDVDIELDDEPAAPTAQQSLTAGGAVPEDERRAFEKWAQTCDGNCNPQDLDQIFWGGDYKNNLVQRDWEVWQASRAAAPLPQVQSEAVGKVWFDSEDRFYFAKITAQDRVKAGMLLYLAAADQQPVTPSGALADNNGGVA